MQSEFHIPPALFPVLLLAVWAVVLSLLALLGGWRELARCYPANLPFSGKRWWFQSGNMRAVNYGGCLIIGANAEGLHLAVLFPFRPGHPPIFIPWSQVSARETTRWRFFRFVELRFSAAPNVPLQIHRGLADKIEQHVGAAWPRAGTRTEPPGAGMPV